MVFYVLCPFKAVSGGPELLHQLVFALNSLNYTAFIAYTHPSSNFDAIDIIPSEYKIYVEDYRYIDDIEDSDESVIIVPEAVSYMILQFQKARKVLWWLSVDNYFNQKKLKYNIRRVGLFKGVADWVYWNVLCLCGKDPHYLRIHDIPSNVYHLVQSRYAADFIVSNGILNYQYLSDYLNESFIEKAVNKQNNRCDKSEIIIYNPKKGIEFTKKLIKYSKGLHFIPLINMTRDEMSNIMSKAKVYIDFGNHPGKDRIPREAAISGCCIITGRKGAAANSEDIMIPETFKFNQTVFDIPRIYEKIEDCINNYTERVKEFDSYIEKIKNEKQIFLHQVSTFAKFITK